MPWPGTCTPIPPALAGWDGASTPGSAGVVLHGGDGESAGAAAPWRPVAAAAPAARRLAGWELEIRLQDTALSIAVGRGGRGLLVDGEPAESVPLDGRPHRVELDVEAV